ncbi:tyrosine-protein kinase TXK-like isoform X2 [Dysidea avara]
MPVNGASNDDGGVRKMSYMVKRSQGKSSFGAINFKKRVFVLTDSKLTYYDGTMERRGSQKGVVDLKKVKVIEKVDDTTFEKPSFQVMHGDLILYVICNGRDEQEEWIALIQDLVKDLDILQEHFHPGTFTNNRWSCCEHRSKHSQGCKETFVAPSRSLSSPGPLLSGSLPTSSIPPGIRSLSPPSSNSGAGRVDSYRDHSLPHSQVNGTPSVPSHRNKALPPLPTSSHHGPLPPVPKKGPVVPPHKKSTMNNDHSAVPTPIVSTAPVPPAKPAHKIRGGYEHTSPNSVLSQPLPNLPSATMSSSAASNKQPVIPPRPESHNSHDTFEVIAMYDYSAPEPGDLPLKKGELVVIFESQRQHWWKARNNKGREGYVPANYVKKAGLESAEWFFPDLSRTRTETILLEEGREGGFVVRNSSRQGMYTLSICHEGQVRHYHIKVDEDKKYYISEKHRFITIGDLIEYHKHNGGGLVTRLRRPPAQLVPSQLSLSSTLDDKWEIDKSTLSLGKEIGSGQFGRVVEGKWKGSIPVAIKMMKEGSMNEDDFIEEAQVMKNFDHENLVKLYGVCSQQGPIFIVTELMKNGALLQYLRNRHDLIFKTDVILDMAVQICSAMQFLESIKFIHRDLAARNCLVGDRNCVKVGDFGLARFVVDDEYTASEGTKFPIKWAAPEVITHARFSSKSDVWSHGILMWELWTGGKTPYPTFSNPQVLDEVLRGYRLERPTYCPPEVYELMRWCWKEQSDDRPTFIDLHKRLKEMAGDDRDYSEANE